MTANGKVLPATTEITLIPDALGHRSRALLIANMLRNVQEKRFTLDLEVVANALGDGDLVPTGAPEGMTVGKWREMLLDVEERVTKKFADLMPRVRELIEAEVR